MLRFGIKIDKYAELLQCRTRSADFYYFCMTRMISLLKEGI